MSTSRVPILIFALSALLGGGCMRRVADLTVASTELVKLDHVNLDQMPTKQQVEGEDVAWVILFIPLGFPHLEDAIDDALANGGGDVMTDITVHAGGWWFIVGQSIISVTGDVANTRRQPAAQGFQP